VALPLAGGVPHEREVLVYDDPDFLVDPETSLFHHVQYVSQRFFDILCHHMSSFLQRFSCNEELPPFGESSGKELQDEKKGRREELDLPRLLRKIGKFDL
jgi:hypothetical protein